MKSNFEILAAPAIAYASVLGGVEVKAVENGVMYCVSGAWCSATSVHRVTVQETRTGRMYVRLHGTRLYLDEILRV